MQLGHAGAPDTCVLERTLKAPIERVWRYFVDADKRSTWFTGGDNLSANGQAFAIVFAHRSITNETPPARWAQVESGASPMSGRVLAFDPPRLLAGERCALMLTVRLHPNWPAYAARAQQGWAKIVGNLGAAMA